MSLGERTRVPDFGAGGTRPLEPVPKAILFDLDDTLCDYSAAREIRLRLAFSLDENGNPVGRPEDKLAEMIVDSLRMHPHGVDHFAELFELHGIDTPGAAKAAADWYRANKLHGLELFADAVTVLRAVRTPTLNDATAVERPIGIVTNGPTEVQRAKLELLGLLDLVDFVIISEEFGVAKPDSQIFHEAINRAGVAAREAVFIGDSVEFDMAGAMACDVPTIWVNPRNVAWTVPGRRPDRVVRDLTEVPALVGSS
jgi:HAD superfamily hydrolase (TIGR01509 family)